MVALKGANINQISRVVKVVSEDGYVDDYNPKNADYLDVEKMAKKIKQKQKRLSEEEVLELAKAYRSGLTVYECAEKFDCHRTTVSYQLKANGVKMLRPTAYRTAS